MGRIPTEKLVFATAINCIDGRAQIPVIERIKGRFGVQYVDMITEPGADGVMASGPQATMDAIKQKVRLSVERHDSHVVVVAAHHDCLANPVSREQHLEHLKQAVEHILSWGFKVRVVALWVNEWWRAEIVSDTGWTGSPAPQEPDRS